MAPRRLLVSARNPVVPVLASHRPGSMTPVIAARQERYHQSRPGRRLAGRRSPMIGGRQALRNLHRPDHTATILDAGVDLLLGSEPVFDLVSRREAALL